MTRVNITLDERTLEALAWLGQRLAIRDRSAVIRHLVGVAVRQESSTGGGGQGDLRQIPQRPNGKGNEGES